MITGQLTFMSSEEAVRQCSTWAARKAQLSCGKTYHFSRREISRIKTVVNEHLGELCRAWEEIHGSA
jgi:hypothetical protein